MVSKKGSLTDVTTTLDGVEISAGPSHQNDSPSGTDSLSPSPISTATPSEDGDAPNDLEQDDESQKGKKRKGVFGKEPRTRKKGQKFQCTGYGDCNLCFTRSEHLSRHIRKHTGEKPYKCFCDRDFSRLDNLRQHAFTVHDPNEIPPGWEHAVKCQTKTAKTTEGRRKEISMRRARKREVRAKNEPNTPLLDILDSQSGTVHPPTVNPPQAQSQRNSYHEYPQGPSQQHQQTSVHQQLAPTHHPQAHIHHQQTLVHQPATSHQAPVHHQASVLHQQLPIHPPAPLHHQQAPSRRQQTPVQHHQVSALPSQAYQNPVRPRPQSLILPSQMHHQDVAFQGYRHTTPPHSPISTPQTPRGAYNPSSDSTLSTPTTTNFHAHRGSISSSVHTPGGSWNETNRRLSMPYNGGIEYGSVHSPSPRTPIPRPRRDPIEAEENRRKRMTWHGGEDAAIGGIVTPLEHTHLDDPRPPRRPRASTYMPAAAPPTIALPSVDALLSTASTPRTIPVVPSALSPRAADRRPSSGRADHSRSRSASHIQPNMDVFTLASRVANQEPGGERLAEVRRRHTSLRFGSPEGPSQDANGIFKDSLSFRHNRSDSSDSLAPPRPMEPSFGATRPEFAPEKAKESGFTFSNQQASTLNLPINRPRARTSAGAKGDKMSSFVFPPKRTDIFEPTFEQRSRGERPVNLDYLATVCNQRIEEEKPRLNRAT